MSPTHTFGSRPEIEDRDFDGAASAFSHTDPDDTAPAGGDEAALALQAVLVGYEGRVLTAMKSPDERLRRIGVWWSQHGSAPPLSVDVFGTKVVVVNDTMLFVNSYGEIVTTLELPPNPPRPSPPDRG